jgi:hypothetical protein
MYRVVGGFPEKQKKGKNYPTSINYPVQDVALSKVSNPDLGTSYNSGTKQRRFCVDFHSNFFLFIQCMGTGECTYERWINPVGWKLHTLSSFAFNISVRRRLFRTRSDSPW